jgi:hypothetical protein
VFALLRNSLQDLPGFVRHEAESEILGALAESAEYRLLVLAIVGLSAGVLVDNLSL